MLQTSRKLVTVKRTNSRIMVTGRDQHRRVSSSGFDVVYGSPFEYGQDFGCVLFASVVVLPARSVGEVGVAECFVNSVGVCNL